MTIRQRATPKATALTGLLHCTFIPAQRQIYLLATTDMQEVDEPASDASSSDVASAPESGTRRPSREHSDSYRQFMAKEAHQEENEFAAPESGDIRDETSGRGHV